MGLPSLTLRQACHQFDGGRVATVAVAVATTLGNRGDLAVSAGERSDAQVRDKASKVVRLQSVLMPGHRSAHMCKALSLVASNLARRRADGGVCLMDAMSVVNQHWHVTVFPLFIRARPFFQQSHFSIVFALFRHPVAWFRCLRPLDLLALEK